MNRNQACHGAQVAIITGSGQGLGAAAAKLFAQHGARVLVTDLDGGKAEQVLAGLAAGRRLPLQCCLTRAVWAGRSRAQLPNIRCARQRSARCRLMVRAAQQPQSSPSR